MTNANQIPEFKRSYQAQRALRHSSRVRVLRRILPVFGVSLVLTVLLWASIDVFFEEKIEGLSHLKDDLEIKNKVINPILTTTDEKGSPLKIQAKSATHNQDDKAEFTKPCCELNSPDGRKTTLSSDDGALDQGKKVFVYRGNVILESKTNDQDKLVFQTNSARVLLDSQDAEGDDEITGQSPMGSLTAKHGFRFDRKQQALTFKGPSKLIINQSAVRDLEPTKKEVTQK